MIETIFRTLPCVLFTIKNQHNSFLENPTLLLYLINNLNYQVTCDVHTRYDTQYNKIKFKTETQILSAYKLFDTN